MTMPSLFPDEEGGLLRKNIVYGHAPLPLFRRRGDAYDHGHSYSFTEEEGDFLRRRLCMVMATPFPFLEGVMPMIMTTPSPFLEGEMPMIMTTTFALFQKREDANDHDQPSLLQKSEDAYSHDHAFSFPRRGKGASKKNMVYGHASPSVFQTEGGCL